MTQFIPIDIKSPTIEQFTADGIITYRCGVEAGYVNNPNDTGGETNHGITKATANTAASKALWTKYGWDGNMRTLPLELAMAIYKSQWWDAMYLDQVHGIHPVLCDRLFDWGINAGRSRAVTALQRILNVCNRNGKDYPDIKVDGTMGPGTLGALTNFYKVRGKAGLRYLITTHSSMQNSYYVDISESNTTNKTFTNGWLSRGYDNDTLYAGLIVKGIL